MTLNRADGRERSHAIARGEGQGRLILVSNRLPATVAEADGGGLELRPSAGGLATALLSLHGEGDGVWVGWPGRRLPASARAVRAEMRRQRLQPVAIPAELVEPFYEGFSNSILWPVLHYAVERAVFDRSWWPAYREANRAFARAVERVWRPGDTVWVHDYHLMLVPAMLRARLPQARIGFFLHTPFPSAEIFRILPWRAQLLAGMLGADLVGFQVPDYLRHFRVAALRVLGGEVHGDAITVAGRTVKVGAFPIGIQPERFTEALATERGLAERRRLIDELGGRRLLLGVDRMDYTKGIPQRLAGYERFLERSPRFHEKVELLLLGVPTRSGVEEYRRLRAEIEGVVGRINGRFGNAVWTPVKYLYRPVALQRLCAFYREASVALVTPLRDGMNLVAKEYVAANRGSDDAVLVLSEFAGASAQLSSALLVNPHDPDDIAACIDRALTMPGAERAARMQDLSSRVWDQTVAAWRQSFLATLGDPELARGPHPPRLVGAARAALAAHFGTAGSRVLLLDYDGTLTPIVERPALARPDQELLALLDRLLLVPGLEVVIVSGRPRATLESWFGDRQLGLVAEHGRWRRSCDGTWVDALGGRRPTWLARALALMEEATEGTPGSEIEEKSVSIAWHYRAADNELADLRVRELTERIAELRGEPAPEVLHGKRVLEVRPSGVGKGRALTTLLAERPPVDLLLVAGDDTTDEDLFGSAPCDAWTIHVGSRPSRAAWSVPDPDRLRLLLADLAATIPAGVASGSARSCPASHV